MRITNSMIFGNSLNNLHRNVRHVNNLVNQIETTKRFQRPSDDPIAAARALRYRTIIEETQQFYRNVQGGLAWMSVTESAFVNMTDEVLQRLNVLFVEAATGHLTIDDRMGLAKEVQELVDQLGLEINQTYMGRYVFSGYRTTQPPVFIRDNDLSFIITQQFDARDIERIMSFQQFHPAHKATVHNANVIKLAYNHVSFDFSIRDENGQPLAIPGIQGAPGRNGEPPLEYLIIVRSMLDENAYLPPGADENSPHPPGTAENPFIVHYIIETGEIVLCDEAAHTWRDGTRITYHKEGFRAGELNPAIYFDSIEVIGNTTLDITHAFYQYPINPDGSFNFSVTIGGADAEAPGTFDMFGDTSPILRMGAIEIPLWSLSNSPPLQSGTMWETVFYTAPPHNLEIIQRVTLEGDGYRVDFSVMNYGVDPVEFELLQFFNPAPDIDAIVSMPPAGTQTALPNVAVSFTSSVRIPPPATALQAGNVINQEDYWIVHEIAPGNHQRINDLARHVYTDKMYTDLKRLMDFIRSVQISERHAVEAYFSSPPHNMLGQVLENAIETQLNNERAQANAVLHDRINNMLELFNRHADNVIAEHTRMGTRMSMFEMMDVRLSEEEAQMEQLLSATADTNMADAIMRKAAAEAALQAAMRAMAMTVQLSLVNFLR
ncbi:MAG: flagellar hook-associated protein FlgL [Defluviitaleaceae bacterium]|nr:flagellar hook-associated protein FlgL [Defluviitaleaceae bacterium]MCL2239523.1 flagellar hook-associated protein FlgL [Defluviitaleaceae bacterium]